MLTIKDIATQTQLSAKQIRDYEKHGLLPHIARTAHGYRLYDDGDIARLTFIAHARQVGFSLAQIKELLALQDDPNRSSKAVKTLTAQHIHALNVRIDELKHMVQTLQTWHDACAGDDGSACAILTGLTTHSPYSKPYAK
ncbi:Cu(I)-responsive transcriptional regulator [Moraxella caviae]|uniref:Cu(I)-responsive transcriptional regulator n=1 Tax=Moraxella caviae TaxID=34060 RepID=A0A1S9ZWJ4_9GAMM|nr:MerR family DNA-binding protein [Moraxella caviae]OOR87848.1 Cu(I)-responsive transcriptional regulator [Moraxella caviae]STZ14883.1 Zn(II)-responsive regulator of zntA [Moraxella caviae]VEW11208.1 Zn(II)-responsive regulator of zntA [Moraxella caviae]VEW13690.1 Zn(II)-responsive regulator of zntA [Moraxella caviae]